MKTARLLMGWFAILVILFSFHAQACDRSKLLLDGVTDLGGGNYQIDLTFCVGAGRTGVILGADQRTGTWAIQLFGATLSSYPASLVSPNTGATFNAIVDADNTRLIYHAPASWWACIDLACGDTSTVCTSFSIVTVGLPGVIKSLGAEGGGLLIYGCAEGDMNVYPIPACSTSTIAATGTESILSCTQSNLHVDVTGGVGATFTRWFAAGGLVSPDLLVSRPSGVAGEAFYYSYDSQGCATARQSVAITPTLSGSAGADKQIYLGYGASCVNLTPSVSHGASPYTYLWSNGSTSASPSVCPTVTTTYTLTVTDAVGCSFTDAAVVNVTDVRCGSNKVRVCHLGTNKCYSVSQVASHLAHGDYLGLCATKMDGTPLEAELGLTVSPVPASAAVSLLFTVPSDGEYQMEVMDLQGRKLALISTGWVAAGDEGEASLDVSTYSPGIYLVRLTDGLGDAVVKKLVVTH